MMIVVVVVIIVVFATRSISFIILVFAVLLVRRLGLSAEVETLREALGALTTTAWEPATSGKAATTTAETAAAIHHTEEDFRVDAAVHPTVHAAATTKHVGRVNQVITAIESCTFPATCVSLTCAKFVPENMQVTYWGSLSVS